MLWAQLLTDVGAPEDLALRLLGGAGPLDLDTAARALVGGGRQLLVIDDIDRGGPEALQVLPAVAARTAASSTAVVVTSVLPAGPGTELRLGGLSESELAGVLPGLEPEARHAVWLASGGLPGVARLLGRPAPATGQRALRRDGQDRLLEAGPERARPRDSRGLHYLRALLAAPGSEIPALDLAAGSPGLIAPDPAPPLDAAAREAYRRRIRELDSELAAADRAADRAPAERALDERQALVGELRQATGWPGARAGSPPTPNEPGSTSPAPSGPPSTASHWPPQPPGHTCSPRSAPARYAGTSQHQAARQAGAPRGAEDPPGDT